LAAARRRKFFDFLPELFGVFCAAPPNAAMRAASLAVIGTSQV